MAISDDKDRIIITTTKELKRELQKLAEADSRNLSNYLNLVLKKYVDDLKENNK